MKLYVVRHGQTNYNIANKVCGKSDVELTDLGKQQAKKASEQLQDIALDLIFASPLKRAYATAKIINENHQLPIHQDQRIQEINFGKFEGVVNNEEFQYYKQNHALHYPEGESLFQVVHRVYSFLEELEKNYPDKNILVVCHGGIVRVIHSYFYDMTNDDLMTWLPQNCCIQCYEK